MIVVGKSNETFMEISCERHIAYELNEYFSFKVPNAQFHPKFKAKMWDGKIRLFNINTGKMYLGLYRYLKEWAQKHSYKFETDIIEATGENVDYKSCCDYINNLNNIINLSDEEIIKILNGEKKPNVDEGIVSLLIDFKIKY